jgi:hypothetical protein
LVRGGAVSGKVTRLPPFPAGSRWAFLLIVGFALGALLLGLGGRVAMRGVAYLNKATPTFSLGGTLTVVLWGAFAGVVGSLMYGLLVRRLPNRTFARGLTFCTVLVLLTLVVMNPPWLSLPLFLTPSVAYGLLLHHLYRRRFLASPPEIHIEPRVNEPPVVTER